MYRIVLKNLGAKLTLREQNLTQVIQIGYPVVLKVLSPQITIKLMLVGWL